MKKNNKPVSHLSKMYYSPYALHNLHAQGPLAMHVQQRTLSLTKGVAYEA